MERDQFISPRTSYHLDHADQAARIAERVRWLHEQALILDMMTLNDSLSKEQFIALRAGYDALRKMITLVQQPSAASRT